LGNKTYLVLNKSNEDWSTYTFVLDILIPCWPKPNEIVTLIAWNSQTEIYINQNGKLRFNDHESSSTINPNEYFRLFISADEKSVRIYLNDKLEIDFSITDDRYKIKSNQIDLFKETNLTKNTTDENTLRVSLKSIIYLNRSIPIDELQSPGLLVPPLEIIAPNLIAMGYKKNWIQLLIEQNQTIDIPRILREQKESFIKTDLDHERDRYRKIFTKLNPSIKPEILDELLLSSKFDTQDQIIDLAQRISIHLLSSSTSDSLINKPELSINWFSQTIQDLTIPQTITEWIRDKTSKTDDDDNMYQLLTLNQSSTKKTEKSVEYSHKNLSSKQFLESRIACEHGLMMIYALSTLLNMLQVWSDDDSTIFPLEKFGDYSLIKLFDQDEKIDRIYSLIKSILQTEIKELLENISESKAPLFNYLQKEICLQSIQILVKPSLINRNDVEDVQQPNVNFILKIFKLFTELLPELKQQQQIDRLISRLFPTAFIQLMFHLFLLIPIHQSKISILHLFTT
jgi:hypothetical protein